MSELPTHGSVTLPEGLHSHLNETTSPELLMEFYKIELARQDIKDKQVKELRARAQWFAFIITMTSIICGTGLVMYDHDEAGIITILAGAGLITAAEFAKKVKSFLERGTIGESSAKDP